MPLDTKEDDPRQEMIKIIPVDAIRPNPYQPRRFFSQQAIDELALSIKTYGLLQPINVRRLENGGYELIAGERRLRASKAAGLTHIKAIVTDRTPDQLSAMIAMIENLQRENLNYFEEAEGYLALIREHGFTQEELAKRLSKNQSTIANKLRILRLPASVKKRLIAAELTERHARALLRLHNESAQLRLLDIVVKRSLSVKETEELVERELEKLYGEETDGDIKAVRGGSRIYLNTIKRTVKRLEEMGAKADLETRETPEFIFINIKVLKQHAAKL